MWGWRRLLRVPWTTRRSNQFILKEINSEYSLEGLMLKLKLQYFDHLMWKTPWKRPWCWEWLKAGGERNDRGWDAWMASPIQWTWFWVNSGSCWWTVRHDVLQFMEMQRVGNDWATELNWTEPSPSLLSSAGMAFQESFQWAQFWFWRGSHVWLQASQCTVRIILGR